MEDLYLKNPYHNSTHAADVVQGLACLFSNNDFTAQLTDLEMLSMILACAIHDVGHPGGLPCQFLLSEDFFSDASARGLATILVQVLCVHLGKDGRVAICGGPCRSDK